MCAWRVDANEISLRDIDTSRLNDFVVWTPEIRRFLQVGRRDNRLFIIAPKGLGKTLLLKAKSQLYRDKASGYSFIPRTELVEKFTDVGTSFSQKDLNRFSSKEIWTRTWELCLIVAILKRFDVELPPVVESVIGDARALADILATVLLSRSQLHELHAVVPSRLRPALRSLDERPGINQVALFVDNIDEAFEAHTGDTLRAPEPGASAVSQKVWINAQLGLVKAAKNLCDSNSHVKVFASIRSEAYQTSRAVTKLQTDSYATLLQYEKSDIEKIFVQNILSTEREALARPRSSNPYERFLGFRLMQHPFAKDGKGRPRQETVFDYLYRHTLGRPREIVVVGEYVVSRLGNPKKRSQGAVRELMHEVSRELLAQYKREIVPYFREDLFAFLCKEARHNVFPKEAAVRVYNAARDQLGFEHILSYFYRLGLVGYVESKGAKRSGKVQRFLPVARYTLEKDRVPEHSDYYLLHPTVDPELREHHDRWFWDHNNIIGPDLAFAPPSILSRQERHMHIGLDRDSLSLCVPGLAKSRRVALVASPSLEWADLRNADSAALRINKERAIDFVVVHDDLPHEETRDRLARWNEGECNLLVFSETEAIVAEVLTTVATLSLTEFSSFAQSLLETADSPSAGPEAIYLCQRMSRASSLAKLRKAVRTSGLEAKVDPVYLDRFTLAVNSKLRRGRMEILVETEDYMELVVRRRPRMGKWSSPNGVRVSRSESEHKFYALKHRLLFEGVYAFEKLVRNLESSPGRATVDRAFEVFVSIQVQRLVKRVDVSVALGPSSDSDLHRELADYAANVRKRVQSLSKSYPWNVAPGLVGRLAQLQISPRPDEFFSFLRQSKYFKDSRCVLFLKELLGIRPLGSMQSVFVSYTTSDSAFTVRLGACLRKRGAEVFMFEHDDPGGKLDSMMVDQIEKKDRLLFIASEESLKSRNCQFELTQARLRFDSDWTSMVIPVDIDGYLFSVRRDGIGAGDKKDEYWENIKFLKTAIARDLSAYRRSRGGEAFEGEVDKLANDLSPLNS